MIPVNVWCSAYTHFRDMYVDVFDKSSKKKRNESKWEELQMKSRRKINIQRSFKTDDYIY